MRGTSAWASLFSWWGNSSRHIHSFHMRAFMHAGLQLGTQWMMTLRNPRPRGTAERGPSLELMRGGQREKAASWSWATSKAEPCSQKSSEPWQAAEGTSQPVVTVLQSDQMSRQPRQVLWKLTLFISSDYDGLQTLTTGNIKNCLCRIIPSRMQRSRMLFKISEEQAFLRWKKKIGTIKVYSVYNLFIASIYCQSCGLRLIACS